MVEATVRLKLVVYLEPGGEDEPIQVPVVADLEQDTLWVYVKTEDIRKEIKSLLNAPPSLSDFGLALHGLAVSQHYRMAWVSARDRARRLRKMLG